MTRHEDDGNIVAKVSELVLEVEPADARKPNIEDKAASGRNFGRTVKEFGGGAEQLYTHTNRPEKIGQRFSQMCIIVNDKDKWRAVFVHYPVPCFKGMVNSNVVPDPGSELALMLPPCAFTIERQIDKPMPIPSGFVV